jgi:hypothetical protein
MLEEILSMIAAGHYWPAFAAGLLALTYVVRKKGADKALRWLAARIPGDDDKQLDHMRAWVPIGLAAVALCVSLALPLGLDNTEAALTALLTTIAAMAGHDVAKSIGSLLQALVPSLRKPDERGQDDADTEQQMYEQTVTPRRRARTTSNGLVLVVLPLASLYLALGSACITPHTRPLASYSGDVPALGIGDEMRETRAECRHLRDRSLLTGAGSAAAGALASGLSAVALPVDRQGIELGLNVTAAVSAGLAAGLALLSTSYSGAMDSHCTPWPAVPRPLADGDLPDSHPPPPPPDRN